MQLQLQLFDSCFVGRRRGGGHPLGGSRRGGSSPLAGCRRARGGWSTAEMQNHDGILEIRNQEEKKDIKFKPDGIFQFYCIHTCNGITNVSIF